MFEVMMKDGEFVVKDEHGIAEVLFRKEVQFFDRPKKRPGKAVVVVMQVRCPICKQYEEYRVVRVVSQEGII
jgi:hypothetical protein